MLFIRLYSWWRSALIALLYGRGAAEDLRRRTEAHETGHALAAWFSPNVFQVNHIRITGPDSGSVSHVIIEHPDGNDRHEDVLWDVLVISLAGMAADWCCYRQTMPTRAYAVDLRHALERAEAIRRLGAAELGRRQARHSPGGGIPASKLFDPPLDRLTAEIIDVGFQEARQVILDHRAEFTRLWNALRGRFEMRAGEIASHFGPRFWAPK